MEIFKTYTQIEPKIWVPWHWTSVDDSSMSLPKDVSNKFIKTMFSVRDMIANASDQQTVIPIKSFFDKSMNRKCMKGKFLGYPWLRWPKISETMKWNSHCDS